MLRVLLIIVANLLFIFHAHSQAKLQIDNETFDMGEVEWNHPATARFNVINTGDKPLVISEIIPDCACSVAQWTMQPIAPGEKGMIEVAFDAKALGSFHKSVAVMSNAEELRYLYFRGKVVEKLKDFSKTHPYVIDGLRIDKQEFVFPDATKGEHPTIELSIVNQSNKPYEPVIMHLPIYVSMEVTPQLIEHGERSTIKLTLDTEQMSNVGLSASTVYLSRFAGDKVGEENALPLKAILLPDFSTLTEKEKANAPKLKVDVKKSNISQTLATKGSAKCNITLTNVGASALKIISVQVLGNGATVNLKKNTLQPNKSTRLQVTLHKNKLSDNNEAIGLLLITNDPKQPKTEINISY
ncbi:MAG: DUF1573 domain-containing protein [Bacteroides sp.]|nr:DUF1573 domain-containing protein [Bacteroides sp.]